MVSSNLFTSFSKRPITLQKHSSGFRILTQLRGLLSLNSVRSQYPFKRLFVHWMKLRKAGSLRYSVARLMHNSNMVFYLKLSYSSLVTLIAQKRFHMSVKQRSVTWRACLLTALLYSIQLLLGDSGWNCLGVQTRMSNKSSITGILGK